MINSSKQVFERIDFIPNWETGHTVQWAINPFFRGTAPFNFSLEISETPEFNELIYSKENLGDVFFATDDSNLKQGASSGYFYRIRLDTANGKTHYSPSTMFASHMREFRRYAMAAEIIRKELLLCRTAGTDAYLLRRKTFAVAPQGQSRVSKNVDPVSGVPISDTKHEDYGVGIDAGYYPAVPCAYYTESSQQDKQLDPSGVGVKETYSQVVRTPGLPLFEVRDIICDTREGYRYSVQSKQIRQFPGTNIPLIQRLSLNLIPPTDTIYSIDIPSR